MQKIIGVGLLMTFFLIFFYSKKNSTKNINGSSKLETKPATKKLYIKSCCCSEKEEFYFKQINLNSSGFGYSVSVIQALLNIDAFREYFMSNYFDINSKPVSYELSLFVKEYVSRFCDVKIDCLVHLLEEKLIFKKVMATNNLKNKGFQFLYHFLKLLIDEIDGGFPELSGNSVLAFQSILDSSFILQLFFALDIKRTESTCKCYKKGLEENLLRISYPWIHKNSCQETLDIFYENIYKRCGTPSICGVCNESFFYEEKIQNVYLPPILIFDLSKNLNDDLVFDKYIHFRNKEYVCIAIICQNSGEDGDKHTCYLKNDNGWYLLKNGECAISVLEPLTIFRNADLVIYSRTSYA